MAPWAGPATVGERALTVASTMAAIAAEPVGRPKNRKDEILATAAEFFSARGYAG